MKMPILMTGSNGQLGWELQRTAPDNVELHCYDVDTLDICDLEAVQTLCEKLRPTWIINAAAYTAVDKAEENKQIAYAVNADGAANLATAAKNCQSRLLHISTDFIFSGNQGKPYQVDDDPDPKSVYGATKLAGEQKVREILGDEALIVRTAWVYSTHGNNFVKTLLNLMQKHQQLTIIGDQIGTPTWANGLANALWHAIEKNLNGTQHWTDAGIASWYDFAIAIQEEAMSLGLLDNSIPVLPIRTEDYPLPAQRPACGVLNKTDFWQQLGYSAPHWRRALRAMLTELKTQL